MVLKRTVSSHRRSLIESDLTNINRQLLLAVNVVHNLLRLGLKGVRLEGLTAIAVELDVRVVHYLLTTKVVVRGESLNKLERIKCRLVVARVTQVVCMYMHRVRQTEVLVRCNQTGNDLSRSNVEVRNFIMDGDTVQTPSPCFGSSGVHTFQTKSAGCVQNPGCVGTGVFDLTVLEVLKQEPVVCQNRHCTFIDDWRVADITLNLFVLRNNRVDPDSLLRHRVVDNLVVLNCKDTVFEECKAVSERFLVLLRITREILRIDVVYRNVCSKTSL